MLARTLMRSPSYPLGSLAKLRGRKVDEAGRDLATATREHDIAERETHAAQSRSDNQARAADLVRHAEWIALTLGELRVVDVARADAWELRVIAERASLAERLAKAQSAESTARDREGQARGQVASRRADAKVIDRHRARWDGAKRQRVEAAEEDASSEAWRPKP